MTTNDQHLGLALSDEASWGDSSEKGLIAAAQEGSREALEQLLGRQRTALYRAARRFRLSREDTEDVVQDAFLRALTHLGTFRRESNFSTWMVAILNNSALSLKRKEKRARLYSLDGAGEFEGGSGWDFPDERVSPEQEAIRQELLLILHAIILKQSKTHQVIFEECLIEGRSIRELAPSLGLTLPSAKSSFFRAKRKVANSFVWRGLVNRRAARNRLRTEASGKGT